MALPSSVALAEEQPPQRAAPPGRVHVQVFAAAGLNEAERLFIQRAVVAGVEAAGSTSVSSDPGLTAMSAAAKKALSRSDRAAADAKKRVRKLDFDGALNLLDWAAEEYARYLPYLVARDKTPRRLVSVHVQMSIVHFLDGKKARAQKALRQALVLQPTLAYDSKVFPPQMQSFVDEERQLFDQRQTGSARIAIEGGPAVVFVNGVSKGMTPLVVRDLRHGPNIIGLVAPGAKPLAKVVSIKGGAVQEVKAEVAVAPSKVTGALAGAGVDVGKPRASTRLVRGAAALKAGGLVLVVPSLAKPDDSAATLSIGVYDMRSKKLVAHLSGTVPRTLPSSETEALAKRSFTRARWELPRLPVKVASKPSLWGRMRMRMDRVRRHEYFWHGIVGAAATVVVLGIAITVASGGLSNGQKVGLFPITRF